MNPGTVDYLQLLINNLQMILEDAEEVVNRIFRKHDTINALVIGGTLLAACYAISSTTGLQLDNVIKTLAFRDFDSTATPESLAIFGIFKALSKKNFTQVQNTFLKNNLHIKREGDIYKLWHATDPHGKNAKLIKNFYIKKLITLRIAHRKKRRFSRFMFSAPLISALKKYFPGFIQTSLGASTRIKTGRRIKVSYLFNSPSISYELIGTLQRECELSEKQLYQHLYKSADQKIVTYQIAMPSAKKRTSLASKHNSQIRKSSSNQPSNKGYRPAPLYTKRPQYANKGSFFDSSPFTQKSAKKNNYTQMYIQQSNKRLAKLNQ